VTAYLLRTDLSQPLDEPDDVRVLDWAPGKRAATVQTGEHGLEFFAGWYPGRPGADLLAFGAAVYCTDRTARRRGSPDGWTRDLRLRLPVGDLAGWRAAGWDDTLRFLTGDAWRVRVHRSARHPLAAVPGVATSDVTGLDVDGVCLFSGGLDSPAGSSTCWRRIRHGGCVCYRTTRAARLPPRSRSCSAHSSTTTGRTARRQVRRVE
jgi:hypothetical protein